MFGFYKTDDPVAVMTVGAPKESEKPKAIVKRKLGRPKKEEE